MIKPIAPITIVLSEYAALAKRHAASLAANGGMAILYPEQQLHPKHHFSQVAKHVEAAVNNGTIVVIVTHSETILNALGYLIEDGSIPHDVVEVVICEYEGARSYRFDQSGYVVGWPMGWFVPDDPASFKSTKEKPIP